jgi:site-specific DNA-methyltransferase (adenine-specific)
MRIQSADDALVLDDDLVIAGDNALVLPRLPEGCFDLIYMDPPFNTGRAQTRHTLSVAAAADGSGDRVGFGGRHYRSRLLRTLSYDDAFADYLAFLEPRLSRARELLAPHGTLYFHIDYREAHYCKLLLDEVFGRDAFLNELIWTYDYGAKPRRRWPAKHDTILVYVRTPGAHFFDADASRTWRPDWSAPRRRRAASGPPTCGFTRSSPPTAARRPGTRPRSPRACSGGSSRPRRARAVGASTRSRAPGRSERFARRWAGGSCSSITTRWRSR